MRALFRIILLLVAGYAVLHASPALACDRGPLSFGELFAADTIVRATAVRYLVEPAPGIVTTGVPDSTVEFKVEEILKGADVPDSIALRGYLGNFDDYNETPVPYRVVRRGGRAGSCHANTYRQGAQFLLFLKKNEQGYTANISPLGPTNEQLNSETDPWLIWVKVRLNPCGKLYEGDRFPERIVEGVETKVALYEMLVQRTNPDLRFQYRAAKCYLQKFGDGQDQYVTYIRKFVSAYERKEEEGK